MTSIVPPLYSACRPAGMKSAAKRPIKQFMLYPHRNEEKADKIQGAWYNTNDRLEGLMVDKTLFMETLRAVKEITKASPEPMTREEIQKFFKDMELSEEQQEMIYQYLQKPQEEPEKEEPEEQAKKVSGKNGAGKSTGSRKQSSHSQHFQMYLNEIKNIKELPEEAKMELYRGLLAGEKAAVSAISTQWLKKIADIAKSYVTSQVLVEDLVQEGNMGLLLGMEELLGAEEQQTDMGADVGVMEQKLESFVREAMERYRQETEGRNSGDHTILAKVNLVHEARKVLAEENGTIPALQELSDYTRIPVEEVRDIMALSQKKGEEP